MPSTEWIGMGWVRSDRPTNGQPDSVKENLKADNPTREPSYSVPDYRDPDDLLVAPVGSL